MLKGAACNETNPCLYWSPCPRCLAGRALTVDDWNLIGFYATVADQVDVIGETPVPKVSSYVDILRMYGYPEADWPWLTAGAVLLHRLTYKLERVIWQQEAGKPFGEIQPWDVN